MCYSKSSRPKGGIVSWNPRGISNKKNELVDLQNEHQPDCFLFQETKLKGVNIFNFDSYNFEHKAQPLIGDGKAKGGVGILVKKTINYRVVNINTIFQAIAIQLNLDRKVTVCSIYIPPLFKFTVKDLEILIKQLPAPFIISGDFNSHNTLWFDKKNDKSGEIIEKFLIENNINLLDGPGQTFRRGSFESHIDLTLISPELHTEYCWNLHDDLCSSDHVPVIISPTNKLFVPANPRWNFNKANWDIYKTRANFDVPIESFNDVDQLNSYINDVIIQAAQEAIPTTKPVEGKVSVPWWNNCLTESKKQKKTAYKKYSKRPSQENDLFYRRKNAEYKRLIEVSKKKYFFQYLSGINTRTSISEVWKRVGSFKPKKKNSNISCLSFENQILLDNKEIANGLAKNMSNISSFQGRNGSFLEYKNAYTEEINFLNYISKPPEGTLLSPLNGIDFSPAQVKKVYNIPITKNELLDAILHCNDHSAAGEDRINYLMVKNLSELSTEYLLKFYNIIFLKGFFPKKWRTAIVIPIAKPDCDPKDPCSYRPISLISCLSKILESIINKRLIWVMEKNSLFNSNQNGFRVGRSTLDNITALVTEINQAFSADKFHVTLFLDLEKAYDTCWKQHVLKQLKFYNFSGCLPLYIKNFLYNRSIKVRANGEESVSRNLDMGIPQGSSLSGTLFLIAINSINTCIKSYMYKSFFVDDARISYVTKSLEQAQDRMQQVLNNLISWGDKTGFNFSESKSVVMIFTNKRGINPTIKLKLGNTILKVVTEKKFLGMIFDHKLNWKTHIEKVKNKSIPIINLLKTLASSKCKTDATILLNVYKALLLPKLEYGSQAYFSAPAYILQPLNVIHNQCLRICLGALRTTPLESLYVESNIMSLEARRQLANIKYFFRVSRIDKQNRNPNIVDIQRPSSGSNINTFSFRVKETLKEYQAENLDILNLRPLPIPPWIIPEIDVCLKICERSKNNHTSEELKQIFYEHKHVSKISMYTDGSKSKRGVGAGVVVFRKCADNSFVYTPYKLKINKHASVFSAELVAIEAAVNSIKNTHNTSCTVYSDSKSALQAILKYDSQNPIIQNIHLLLVTLKEKNTKIRFCWVPAHCGIKGNEFADKIAKEATKYSKNCKNPILFSDIKAFIKNEAIKKWQHNWNSKVNNKLFSVDSSVGKKYFSGFNTRIEEIKFTRLRLGHTKLTHSFRYTNEPQPVCNICQCFLTIQHILTACTKYNHDRTRFFGKSKVNISDILARGNYQKMNQVLKFLKFTRLFSEI